MWGNGRVKEGGVGNRDAEVRGRKGWDRLTVRDADGEMGRERRDGKGGEECGR